MTKEHFCILPDSLNKMDNAEVREHFLLEDLFQPGKCVSHYVQEDRLLIFGLMPAANEAMTFESEWFQSSAAMLERREMGIVNIGEQAEVTVDGKAWTLEHMLFALANLILAARPSLAVRLGFAKVEGLASAGSSCLRLFLSQLCGAALVPLT